MSLRMRLVPMSRLDQGQQAAGVLERQNRRLRHHAVYASQWEAADDSWAGMALAEPGLVTVVVEDHTAERPSWDCRVCGKPWPCDPAREVLIVEMDRVSLAIFMWVNLEEAVRDMPPGPASDLFDRFIRWTH